MAATATTTTKGRTLPSTYPTTTTTTNPRGATPHHDRHPATVDKYHAPLITGE